MGVVGALFVSLPQVAKGVIGDNTSKEKAAVVVAEKWLTMVDKGGIWT